MPDYAVDKHTRRGKELGRGRDEFFATGIELANPAPIDDPYLSLAQQALAEGLSARPDGPIESVPSPEDPLATRLPGEETSEI